MAVNQTYSKDLMSLLNGLLASTESVLDIGSGIGVLLEQYASRLILALDIHRPFLEQRVYKSAHIIPVNANAMKIDHLFMPGSIANGRSNRYDRAFHQNGRLNPSEQSGANRGKPCYCFYSERLLSPIRRSLRLERGTLSDPSQRMGAGGIRSIGIRSNDT